MIPLAREEWTRPALFLADLGGIGVGATLTLDGDEGRHAADVRRLRPGEVVLVGDGEGARVRLELTEVARGTVTGRVRERRDDPLPDVRVTVVQALVKGDRGELAVELATEAGADAVVPWRAERSVARWEDGPRGAKALGRWRSTVREAAKQGRRAYVPEVADPMGTAQVADLARRADLALVCEGTAPQSLATVPLPATGEVLLVVGPEGGVSPRELEVLTAAGAVGVRMGPDVLRTSSAAAVALGALGARTGRWT